MFYSIKSIWFLWRANISRVLTGTDVGDRHLVSLLSLHFLVIWTWLNYLASLNFSFFVTKKRGANTVYIPQGVIVTTKWDNNIGFVKYAVNVCYYISFRR